MAAGVVLLAAGPGETSVARAGRGAVSSKTGPVLPPQPHFQYGVTLAVSVMDIGEDPMGGGDDVASWKGAWKVTVTAESAPHNYRILDVTGGGTSVPPVAGTIEAKESFRGLAAGPDFEKVLCSGEAGGTYPALLSVGGFVNAPTGTANSLSLSAGPRDLGQAQRGALEAKWEANCTRPYDVTWGRFAAEPVGLPFATPSGIAFGAPVANGLFLGGHFDSAKAVPKELSDLLAGKSFSISSGSVTGTPTFEEGKVTESVTITFTRTGSAPQACGSSSLARLASATCPLKPKKPAKKPKKPKKKPPAKKPCPTPKEGLSKDLRPNAETLQHIKKEELPGGSLTAKFACGWRAGKCSGNELYNDPVGYCTIGWGHLLQESECTGDETQVIGGETVSLKNGLTPAQAQALFEEDVASKVKLIQETIKAPLTQGQYDALFDFVYNAKGYTKSTLRKDINCEKYGDVPTQFNKWIYAHNDKGELVELEGLAERRAWEIEEWLQ